MEHYLRLVYACWSRVYDRWIDRVFAFYRAAVMKALAPGRKERVLEIGVGTGLNLPYYPAGVSVVGIDFSQAMLARAKRKKTEATVMLRRMDARAIACPANSFDKALATYVLRVTPDPRAVLVFSLRRDE